MNTLPIFLKVRGRECLVIGAGPIACRKIELLLKAGAQVTVAAPTLSTSVEALSRNSNIVHHPGSFAPDLLTGKCLVVAATNDPQVNQQVYEHATHLNIPVNVVDQPDLCTFIFPSIVDRSPIVIATSSDGQAPVLARMIREKIEGLIPAGYGKLARIAGKFRAELKKRIPSVTARRYFWENIFNGSGADRVLNASESDGIEILRQHLNQAESSLQKPEGEVYIVGAGPGNPDLLTFRALKLMQQADVVLYDRLVSDRILDLIRRDAEKIYVGKTKNHHVKPQAEINRLLLTLARDGKRVCRLKGGDPFIFGRGGEELEELAAAGINFQVVPGITAATGCAAYAGIPLTHRDYAQSCLFVTGHLKDGKLALAGDIDWKSLTRANQTVVFYMGLKSLPSISKLLRLHGMPADRPAAIIENGTETKQRVLTGTIGTLPELAESWKIDAPALIIIGEVVKLRTELAWFNNHAEVPPLSESA